MLVTKQKEKYEADWFLKMFLHKVKSFSRLNTYQRQRQEWNHWLMSRLWSTTLPTQLQRLKVWHWLLPRDPMHSAVCAVARCLSVCLLHAGILSERLNVFSNLFSSSFFLVFPKQTARQKSDGDALRGESSAGYEKITIFHQYLALLLKWYKIKQ